MHGQAVGRPPLWLAVCRHLIRWGCPCRPCRAVRPPCFVSVSLPRPRINRPGVAAACVLGSRLAAARRLIRRCDPDTAWHAELGIPGPRSAVKSARSAERQSVCWVRRFLVLLCLHAVGVAVCGSVSQSARPPACVTTMGVRRVPSNAPYPR